MDWRREKLGRMNFEESKRRRDMQAVKNLREGEKVRTPDGWTGFIEEVYPREGEIAVASWDRSGTYGASEVHSTERSKGQEAKDPEFDFGGGW